MQPKNQLLITISKILEEILKETDLLSLQQASLFHTSRAPSISIQNYIQRIAKYTNCNSVCFVLALIYLDKVQGMHKQIVCSIQIVFIVSIMVAIKYYEDEYYKNEYYAKVGGLSLQEINKLEMEFLDMLNYELFIQKEVFEIYEERLKQCEIIEI